MKDRCVSVFVTAPGANEAKKIAARVVGGKLAACASIIGGLDSSYWWKGKIEHSCEVLIIMKTRASLMEKLVMAVKKEHSYRVPEIIAVPITHGNRDYLKWIEESVANL